MRVFAGKGEQCEHTNQRQITSHGNFLLVSATISHSLGGERKIQRVAVCALLRGSTPSSFRKIVVECRLGAVGAFVYVVDRLLGLPEACRTR